MERDDTRIDNKRVLLTVTPSNKASVGSRVGPKAISKKAPPGFNSAETLEKIDRATDDIKGLRKALKDVQEVNRLMLIVLFVGFLALLFSIVGAGIDAFRAQTTSQDQLNSSVQQLMLQMQTTKGTPTTNAAK